MKKQMAVTVISFLVCLALGNPFAAPTDSASFHTLKPGPMEPNYPSQMIPIDPYRYQSYDNLPACPGDPASTSSIAHPICPDISGNYPQTYLVEKETYKGSGNYMTATFSGSVSKSDPNTYCPDVCVTKQKVVKSGSTISKVFFPICPVGYAKIAEFDVQSEYKYTSSGITEKPLSMEKYLSLKNKEGWSCTLGPTSSATTFRGCAYTSSSAYSNYASIARNVDTTYQGYAGRYQDAYKDLGQRSPNWSTRTNISGAWDSYHTASKLYSGYCYYTSAGLDHCENFVAGWPTPGQGGCSISTTYTVWMHYYFRYYQCSVPAGSFYQTGFTMPSAYVCVRSKEGWQKKYSN